MNKRSRNSRQMITEQMNCFCKVNDTTLDISIHLQRTQNVLLYFSSVLLYSQNQYVYFVSRYRDKSDNIYQPRSFNVTICNCFFCGDYRVMILSFQKTKINYILLILNLFSISCKFLIRYLLRHTVLKLDSDSEHEGIGDDRSNIKIDDQPQGE